MDKINNETMFADYPAVPPRHRHRYECCKAWSTFTDEYLGDDLITWTRLHKLAHSRVAFTDEHLTTVADVSMATAQVMTYAAVRMHWIEAAVIETPLRPEQGTMWVGTLQADR